jgi:uncharacterized membrane protein
VSGSSLLAFVVLLAASIWIGGFVTLVVVARIARRHLEPADRVEFFRALGRSWGVVSGGALLVVLAGGVVLLNDHGWDGTAVAAMVLAGCVVLATAAGVVQARGITRLRRRAVGDPGDQTMRHRVRRGARRAAVLRAAIGVLSLATLYLAAVIAT